MVAQQQAHFDPVWLNYRPRVCLEQLQHIGPILAQVATPLSSPTHGYTRPACFTSREALWPLLLLLHHITSKSITPEQVVELFQAPSRLHPGLPKLVHSRLELPTVSPHFSSLQPTCIAPCTATPTTPAIHLTRLHGAPNQARTCLSYG